MLKFQYKDLESIPEGLENHYVLADDGTYKLKVEGAVEKARLDEFRANNKKLMSDLEAAKADYESTASKLASLNTEIAEKYGNVDVEEYNKMLAKQKALKEQKLIEAGKHEELLKLREDELRNEFSSIMRKQKDTLTKTESSYKESISKLEKKLSTLLIDNRLTALATQYSVRPTAVEDVLSRGRSTWRIEDGQAIAYDGNGNRMYGPDGSSLLDMETWMESLATNAPHLFEASSGSGNDIDIDGLLGELDDYQTKDKPSDEPGQEYMTGSLADIREGLDAL